MRFRISTLALGLLPCIAFAQSEAALRSYFEGRYVRSKIDLPGTHEGLDINYRQDPPIDFRLHQRRLNEWGAAVPAGTEIAVTLIRVKGKNIEFQLGGGGLNESGYVNFSTTVPKSSRESDLERDIRDETDSRRRESKERELNRLRDSREREERRLRAEKERLEILKKQELHEKALRFGSRINVWFQKDYLKESAPTPQELMRILDPYVDFSPMERPRQQQQLPRAPEMPGRTSVTGLKRGMEISAVHQMLGNPSRFKETKEGSINLLIEAWDFEAETLEVDYAEGVLLRWRVFSK